MVTLKVEGVQVEITSGDPAIEVKKDVIALASFKCACGATVKVTKENLRSPTPVFAIPLSIGFDDVKKAMEYAKRWNQFPKGLAEFFRHERSYLYPGGSATDSYQVDVHCYCENCNREYNLPARFTNPVERKPVPSLIEAWKTFDHETELSKTALTRVAYKYRFNTTEELAVHIETLLKDIEKLAGLLSELEKPTVKVNVNSEIAKDFVRALRDSLNELGQTDFKREIEQQLNAILSDIKEASLMRTEEETVEGSWVAGVR
jgi:hypothetical protein